MRGGRQPSTPRDLARRRRSRIGSIIARVEGVRGVQARGAATPPRAPAARASASTASAGPADDAEVRAVDRGQGEVRRRAAAGPRPRAAARRASRPPAAPASAAPRAATSASASSSENTPARQAATYSPTLWPSIACGLDPPGHPQPGQRVLDGEQRRLGEDGLAQRARAGLLRPPARRRSRSCRAGRGRGAARSSSQQRSSVARGRPARRR